MEGMGMLSSVLTSNERGAEGMTVGSALGESTSVDITLPGGLTDLYLAFHGCNLRISTQGEQSQLTAYTIACKTQRQAGIPTLENDSLSNTVFSKELHCWLESC